MISPLAKQVLIGVGVATVSFIVLGTVSALWDNPLFVRMTPTGSFEVPLLALQSLLLGIFFGIPLSACASKLSGTGSAINFVGIACPICNKILLLIFGTEALLMYLEPARLYLAVLGVILTGAAVLFRWRMWSMTMNAAPRTLDRSLDALP